ncbi:MAG: folate-binding protein YgfZ [Alphaproteobacteria bacterium]|nr:folate-binding protein YgfZ [Alphaproteobacteria bacterium]
MSPHPDPDPGAAGAPQGRARFVPLPRLGVLAVTGARARAFLQGLLTADMERLGPGVALPAALLTPQGKIEFDLVLLEGGAERVFLTTDAARADELLRRLTLYRLRTPVTIEDLSAEVAVHVLLGAGDRLPEAVPAGRDLRHPDLGQRVLLPREGALAWLRAHGYAPAPAGDYAVLRHRLGIPEGADELPPGRVFALEAGLDRLGAVSFTKGCYVGQELTARMKHKTTLRKRLLPVDAEAGTLAPETELRLGATAVGESLSAEGAPAFALLRLDRLAEAGWAPGQPLDSAAGPVQIIWPVDLALPQPEAPA